MRIIASIFIFLASLISSDQIPGSNQDHPILVRGGTIHTVSHGTLENTDILFENGKIVLAHCANPGSMYGLIKKDLNTWLSISDDPNRKTNYSWELACINNAMIGINTHNPNKIIYVLF